jgi:cephalosporin hydroxylase
VFDDYHRWYAETARVHGKVTFLGVPVCKYVGDLWNYQEIITEVRPTLIVEAGTASGGAALYFAEMARAAGLSSRVLAVDPDHNWVGDQVRQHPQIELLTLRSTDPSVVARIRALREEAPGPMMVSLDSDHSKGNVLAELMMLRELTQPGDYLVVEDGNINGPQSSQAGVQGRTKRCRSTWRCIRRTTSGTRFGKRSSV